MSTDQPATQHPPEHRPDCARVRLAESSVAGVDVCGCGILHLHLGPLTLRLAPCALSELLGTLGQAVAEHAARRVGLPGAPPQALFGARERHEA